MWQHLKDIQPGGRVGREETGGDGWRAEEPSSFCHGDSAQTAAPPPRQPLLHQGLCSLLILFLFSRFLQRGNWGSTSFFVQHTLKTMKKERKRPIRKGQILNGEFVLTKIKMGSKNAEENTPVASFSTASPQRSRDVEVVWRGSLVCGSFHHLFTLITTVGTTSSFLSFPDVCFSNNVSVSTFFFF